MLTLLGHKKNQLNQGFTIIEIMVALVILAVGLLGMAGMTVVVMRGSRGAEDLASATNVCQQKIEELKDVVWADLGNVTAGDPNELNYGLQSASMIQEINLNSQGLTWNAFCNQQSAIVGSPCEAQSSASCSSQAVSADCKTFLDQAGPYKYTRTFSICKGEDYSGGSLPMGSTVNLGGFTPTYSAEPNCMVDPTANASFRPQALACEDNDILTKDVGSPEKMIKILCTWRSKEGRCSYVNFEALRMNNL